MESKHPDRTYTDEHGVAPRPEERGVSPPPPLSPRVFRSMSLAYLLKWADYRDSIPTLEERDGSIDDGHLLARRALDERRTKRLPDVESGAELLHRAQHHRAWIISTEGTTTVKGEGEAEDTICCKTKHTDDDDDDENASYYRLYGTMLFICARCFERIKQNTRHMPRLNMPYRYGAADLKADLWNK